MEKGISNGINRLNTETGGYAIQEFSLVKGADVDGVSYFGDNVDVAIKRIDSYNINHGLMKTEIFTYGILEDLTKVKKIYCVYKDKNFKGTYTSNVLPIINEEKWYYIEGNPIIGTIQYNDGDIFGCIKYGEIDSYRWTKCMFSADGKLINKA